MKKETKLIVLIGWFVLSAAGYFGAVRLEFEPITPIYAAMSIIFGVLFFLVNGGIRPIVKVDSPQNVEKISRKKERRMRYSHTQSVKKCQDEPPRANIFKLSPQKQKLYAELLLILFIAPTVILAADYLLIAFLPDYI